MSGLLLLLIQGVIYFATLAALFYKRKTLGLGVFICVLGTLHFLETYFAAALFIELPFGLLSAGSVVLFTGKLAFLLLLYIKEDAESMRQPTYGLLAGNVLIIVLALLMRLYHAPAPPPSAHHIDLGFLDQMGLLMVWGTILLFVDLVSMVIIYERLATRTIPGRIFISLALVLTFDQLCFYAGLHWLTGAPSTALYGGWVAKMGAAALFTLMLTLYLRFVEKETPVSTGRAATDVFDRLTYRHRYEKLAERIGRDALTGLQNRGQFDVKGPAMLARAARSGLPVCLMMIDIDHFKEINDRYGHPVGDRTLRDVAATIAKVKREGDELFRYGGEEFSLLCPGMSPDAVLATAQRIRTAVAGAPYPTLGHPVTISIGIASFPAHAREFPALLIQADRALYRAKELGRDRIWCAGQQ